MYSPFSWSNGIGFCGADGYSYVYRTNDGGDTCCNICDPQIDYVTQNDVFNYHVDKSTEIYFSYVKWLIQFKQLEGHPNHQFRTYKYK